VRVEGLNREEPRRVGDQRITSQLSRFKAKRIQVRGAFIC